MPSNAPDQAPRRPGTIRIGSIVGVDVFVTSSWFVVAALVSYIIAPRIEDAAPGLGPLTYVAGLAFAVVLYASVLIHEAAHAVMARHYGYPVGSITLNFLGGVTHVHEDWRRPKHEFLIAVVGPLTSLAVGGIGVALWLVVPDGLLRTMTEALAVGNLLIGVLNLVPGLPLDGGRVLKSAVWRVTGDVHRATLVAGWGGRLTALAVLLTPFAFLRVFDARSDVVDLLVVLVMAGFLWHSSSAAIRGARLRRRLPRLVARPLARQTLMVPADLPLAEAVRRAQDAHAGSIVTVGPAGEPVGIVNEAAVLATPAERRPWLPTSTVARSLGAGLTLPADIAGEELVHALRRRPSEEYLLVEPDGTVHGVLTTADVDRAFREDGH